MTTARPVLLFYCQHVLGMGHLKRSLALARAFSAHFRVVFLNGGRVPDGIARPAGVEFVDLLPLALGPDGRLVSPDRRRSVPRVQDARRATILETFARVRPAAVVVELFPFGRRKFAPELVPLFETAHLLGQARPRLLSSVRDLLVTGRDDQARHDTRASELANRYLDAVLVHADPRFARLEETFQPRVPLAVPVHHTGFVVDDDGASDPPARAGHVLVSAGGGLVGGPLLDAAVAAHDQLWEEERLPMTVVAGPFVPAAEWHVLEGAARRRPGLTIRRVVPDLLAELRTAAVSVSQCGYNTALELVRAAVPAVVVPYREAGGQDEQMVRARRLAHMGLVRVVHPSRLDGAALARAIRAVRRATPARAILDLDGAPRSATLVAGLVATPLRRRCA